MSTLSEAARRQQQFTILASMYLAYGAMMVCRQIVTILSPAMMADESLSLVKADIGDFAAWGTIGALVGKVIWGPLADVIGGRRTMLIGLALSALLVSVFGLSPGVGAFTIFSFLLYGAKSSGWPGMAKLVGEWYHPSKYGRTWGVLSTSSRLSVVVGTLFFGWLLSQMDWRWVAIACTVGALLIGVVCFRFLRDKPSEAGFLEAVGEAARNPEVAAESARALENRLNHPLRDTSLAQGLLAFAKSGRCWLVVGMLMLLTCMMALLDFVSVYLMEVYSLTPSQAAMSSTVFPAGSLAGLLAAVAFYDRFSKKGLRRVLTIMMGVAVACVLLLQYLPEFGLGDRTNYVVALTMIGIFGFVIAPAYYLPMSIFSIEFGGPRSATLVCLIDAFGFAASAIFGFAGGRLADTAWSNFMNMLVGIAVLGAFAVWGFLHAEYKVSLNKT